MTTGRRVRLELDERRTRALHAALHEVLGGQLLAGDQRDAASEVLEQLDRRVPGWLTAAPIGGEAGYLLAAEAVLRTLVDAEDRGRSELSEIELVHALADAKPLGSTATDVLDRMRRERLLRRRRHSGERDRWAAAPAGRQFLHRNTAASADAWTVRDADALLDLLFAEHRPGVQAHRPSVQAIGRLDDASLERLLVDLQELGNLEAGGTNESWIALSWQGAETARARWRESAPAGHGSWEGPPAPPRPYRRELPIRLTFEDRRHPDRWGEESARSCMPASWLQRSSKTKLWATLRRDGAATWRCQRCDSWWLVYLQACTADGRPAYRDPAAATQNRPFWRPTHRP